MWISEDARNRGRMFPNWSVSRCNEFLTKVRDSSRNSSIEDQGAHLLKQAVALRSQGSPHAEKLFQLSKVLSEVAYFMAGSPDAMNGARTEEEVDLAIIIGLYQIAGNTLQLAREALSSKNIEVAAAYVIIAKEQLAIFTAAIKTNRIANKYTDIFGRSKMESINIFVSANEEVGRMAGNLEKTLLDEKYSKHVAIPLSILIANFLIADNDPNASDFFRICSSGVQGFLAEVMSGRIDKAIDALSHISNQIPG
jgi:hypothetical protein